MFVTDSCDIVDLRPISTTNTKAELRVTAHRGPPRKVQAIMDGGSGVSFVAEDLAKSIKLKIDHSCRLPYYDVNGNLSRSIGCAQVVVEVAGKKYRFKFHVAPKPSSGAGFKWSMIIGTDFLKASGLILDYEREEVYRRELQSTHDKLIIGEPVQKQLFAVVDAEQGMPIDLPGGRMFDLPVRCHEPPCPCLFRRS